MHEIKQNDEKLCAKNLIRQKTIITIRYHCIVPRCSKCFIQLNVTICYNETEDFVVYKTISR